MSHFTVLVAVPADTEDVQGAVARALAPYSEELAVAPFRDYEDGAAEDYWLVSAMRREAQEAADGKPIDPPREDRLMDSRAPAGTHWANWKGGYATLAEHEEHEREDRRQAVATVELLGPAPTTWRKVVEASNRRWHPELPVHLIEYGAEGQDVERLDAETQAVLDGNGDLLLYDAVTERAFTWSTRNPQGFWDWWSIGGRWKGYFRLKALTADVIQGHPGTFDNSSDDMGPGLRGDGAPKGLIDLDAMRGDKAAEAHATFDAWEALVKRSIEWGFPAPKSWAHYRDMATVGIDADGNPYDIDAARRDYGSQWFVGQLRKHQFGSGKDVDKAMQAIAWADDPVADFAVGRDEYVKIARDAAVPGYAFVDLDGQWIAPGKMGWFGMSSDDSGERDGYRRAVNTYIDEKMTDADILVLVDAHV